MKALILDYLKQALIDSKALLVLCGFTPRQWLFGWKRRVSHPTVDSSNNSERVPAVAK